MGWWHMSMTHANTSVVSTACKVFNGVTFEGAWKEGLLRTSVRDSLCLGLVLGTSGKDPQLVGSAQQGRI